MRLRWLIIASSMVTVLRMSPVCAEPAVTSWQPITMLEKGDYIGLDSLEIDFRNRNLRSTNDQPMVGRFFAAFHCHSEEVCKTRAEQVGDWIKAEPDSAVAHMVAAQVLRDYAWVIRGDGYNSTVTADRREKYITLEADALHQLQQIPDSTKDPFKLSMGVKLEGEIGDDREMMHRLYKKGVAAFPDYWPLYTNYAQYVEAKWGGSDSEEIEFQKSVLTKPGSDNGQIAYYLIAERQLCCGTPYIASHVDWKQLRKSFLVTQKRFGGDFGNWSAMTKYAWINKDYDYAADAYGHALQAAKSSNPLVPPYWTADEANSFRIWFTNWLQTRAPPKP